VLAAELDIDEEGNLGFEAYSRYSTLRPLLVLSQLAFTQLTLGPYVVTLPAATHALPHILQGYLAHKKLTPPPRSTIGP